MTNSPVNWEFERSPLDAALSRMTRAGWVSSYAISPAKGLAIEWTEHGEQCISALWNLLDALGTEQMDKELLWAIRTLAVLQFRPGEP